MTREVGVRGTEPGGSEQAVNYTSLSKAMSKALRHQPERIGITLAADGSVALPELIDALNRRGGWPRELDEADIMQVVEHGTKRRFAVEDGRIRARYGHSVQLPIAYERADPPAVLYHGTSEASAEAIMTEGLRPMGRQVVHLSADVQTAWQVGARHRGRTVILVVDAAQAACDGIAFYRGNDDTWLADAIPARYLSIGNFERGGCR